MLRTLAIVIASILAFAVQSVNAGHSVSEFPSCGLDCYISTIERHNFNRNDFGQHCASAPFFLTFRACAANACPMEEYTLTGSIFDSFCLQVYGVDLVQVLGQHEAQKEPDGPDPVLDQLEAMNVTEILEDIIEDNQTLFEPSIEENTGEETEQAAGESVEGPMEEPVEEPVDEPAVADEEETPSEVAVPDVTEDTVAIQTVDITPAAISPTAAATSVQEASVPVEAASIPTSTSAPVIGTAVKATAAPTSEGGRVASNSWMALASVIVFSVFLF